MKLGEFKVDCTPPSGTPVGFGLGDKTLGVDDRLWLRGVVLDDDGGRCVVVSMDFCGLMNSAYDQVVNAIASGSDVSADRVIVHCIHQHDAPLVCFEIEDILDVETFPRSWWNGLLSRISSAAGKALSEMMRVDYVGHAETEIEGYASNRRIVEDGKVVAMRFSKCADPELKERPVGVIDPFLRTVAFKGSDGQILASWSFYATHPQVANGRRLFSADAPGEAVRIIDEEFFGSLTCFFTGPGGDVTAGKYTSPTDLEGNLKKFGMILANGISNNLNSMRWEKCERFKLDSDEFEFPRKDSACRCVEDENIDDELLNAVLRSCREYDKNKTYSLRLLTLGTAGILFFPGEPFVEHQLFACSLRSDSFIAAAGNCSDNFLYLPLRRSFDEGGYEVDTYRWCDERIEDEIRRSIEKLLSRCFPEERE